MLENFLPVHPSGSRGNTVKNAKRRKKGKAEAAEDGNGGASVGGAWPPESGVHCLAWNPNGLSKAHLLVSGTASGLCRVDVLSGWLRKDIKEKAPTTATVDDDESMDEV
ncbi:hypothetical protein FRB99_008568 [Tulasnella sp. 403]|nr:hypothetical protein FRB99_008568 [Tulasnella sp. 403]